jgi:hypothetical protein
VSDDGAPDVLGTTVLHELAAGVSTITSTGPTPPTRSPVSSVT